MFMMKLFAYRNKNQQYGARLYKQTDREYSKIRNICKHIIEFKDHYKLTEEEAIDIYIQLFFDILGSGKFSLHLMLLKVDDIFEKYGEILEVSKYSNKQLALDILAVYSHLTESPPKSIFESNKIAFVRCAKQIDGKFDKVAWVKAQIDYFNNYNLPISPNSLYGEKALKRFNALNKNEDLSGLTKKIFS
jgi:hypothetical protein